MSLSKSVIYDGQLQRQVQQGDVVCASQVVPATNATQNITVTAAMLLNQYLLRSNGAAMADTLDTAANLVAGLNASANGGQVQNGTTFVVRWIVTTAFAVTVQATANTGVTVNRGTVAASTAKDFLVTVVNSTPAQTYAGTTTNASAVVGLTSAQAATLSVGMIVTNAVAGLQGTTIIAINISSGQVTMSGNANATNAAPGVAISFSPVVTLDGLAA